MSVIYDNPTSKNWPHVQKNVGKMKDGNFGRGEFRVLAEDRQLTVASRPQLAV
jgi:hypothetical protein